MVELVYSWEVSAVIYVLGDEGARPDGRTLPCERDCKLYKKTSTVTHTLTSNKEASTVNTLYSKEK